VKNDRLVRAPSRQRHNSSAIDYRNWVKTHGRACRTLLPVSRCCMVRRNFPGAVGDSSTISLLVCPRTRSSVAERLARFALVLTQLYPWYCGRQVPRTHGLSRVFLRTSNKTPQQCCTNRCRLASRYWTGLNGARAMDLERAAVVGPFSGGPGPPRRGNDDW